jgi:hypothetical protein
MIAKLIATALVVSAIISIPATILFYRWLWKQDRKKNGRSFPGNFGWDKRLGDSKNVKKYME